MGQEKRMMLAIVLSIAVLFVYQYFMPAPPPQTVPPGGKDNAAVTARAGETAGAPRAALPGPAAPGSAATPGGSTPGGLAPGASAAERSIEVRTPLFTARISTSGGGITSYLLKSYKDSPGPNGKMLDLVGSKSLQPPPLSIYKEENRPPFPSPMIFRSDAPEVIEIAAGGTGNVLLTWESTTGVRVTREYVFRGDRYDFDVRLQATNGSKEPVSVRPGLELSQQFVGELAGDSYTFHGIATFSPKGEIERYSVSDIAKGKVEKGQVRWASADSKYFTWVAIPEREWSVGRITPIGEQGALLSMADSAATLLAGDTVRTGAKVFAGPKQSDLLASAGKGLEELIDYGWFGFLAKPLVFLMKASNRVTGNYGIDIILLTILIKILFFPLTQKSMASMRKMQELAPVLNKLKEKYKGDMNRINQETMNLYKTYKINPLSGCLPMLAQIPVFIALYKGLLVTIELRHAPFFAWINDLSAPEYLWDIHLAGFTLPIRLLPLLMGVSMVIQQKMTPAVSMDPMQQKLMLLMPVVFTFMFWGFPTGLVLYWLVNNILSIGQQWLYNRQADAAKAAKA
jgi:YidC/Oxa1 family membrane protein insertase